MNKNSATFCKNGKWYTIYGTGLPILNAGLKHLLESNIRFLRDVNEAKEIKYVMDVGANMGYTAMMYHFAFPDAKIVAVEPSTYNYEYLQVNVSGIDNIVALQCAASNENCELTIALPTKEQRNDIKMKFEEYDNTGAISVYGESDLYKETVQARRLDDIAEQEVDYLKIDVEGYELETLMGANRILSEDKPIVQMEMRPINQIMAGRDIHEVHRYICDFGYVRLGFYEGDSVYGHKTVDYKNVLIKRIKNKFKAPTKRQLETFKFHLVGNDIKFLRVIGEVKPIRTIVDVGASIGVMSVVFKSAFSKSYIYAIEPSKENYKYLYSNTRSFEDIKCIKAALSNYDGKINIAMPTEEQRPEMDDEAKVNPAIVSVYGESDLYAEEVNCYKLDNITQAPIDLLKIDAEGHEIEVLEGGEIVLTEHRPIVMLNFREGTQNMAGRTRVELHQKMLGYGYKRVGHYKGDGIYIPKEYELPLDSIPENMKGEICYSAQK